MNETQKIKRLKALAHGFGNRFVTDDEGRKYFAFGWPYNTFIAASGHTFEQYDTPKQLGNGLVLTRPSIGWSSPMPDGFREIGEVRDTRTLANTIEWVYYENADAAPLDYVLSVYETAFTAAPMWIKALVWIRSIFAVVL